MRAGDVIVTKNPCMHPGDIRKLTAVNVPQLHHVRDCIVFPAKGDRPHPDNMAEDAPPEWMGKQQFQPCQFNEHFTELGSAKKHEHMMQANSTRISDCSAARMIVMVLTARWTVLMKGQ
ncbi:hypothetical protein HPB51_029076 [Rhipicephalus microplus]|uniref:RNA-dependent RNA polymerase n=1 Tax=Rhipicephalus microplus TaxID=6941 RepID=A0A9J6CVK0_RHIMP|nr:hypothetical protein HPB51_029076 [Rhipicephalus microplus]